MNAYWIFTFCILVVVLSILSFFYLRLRKEFNIILQKKNRYFSKNIELTNALQNSHDHEEKILKDISTKLHDDIGGDLTSALLLLNSLERNMHDFQLDIALRMRKHLAESIRKMRDFSKDLYPPSLVDHGLTLALNELCNYVSHPTISVIRFESLGEPRRLFRSHELILFRAVQELINNAFKHSCAYNINVKLYWEPQLLVLDVLDNGKGFPFKDSSREGGSGLKKINIALDGINAKLMFPNFNTHKGTHIRIKYIIENYG